MCELKKPEQCVPEGFISTPNIDQLVDGAVDHKVLSFLDAYSYYNQISMHHRDKENTTFMTTDVNYYYEVMSFGLKNAEATYQRLMDKIFQGLIVRCVEVYVDDIVVKSDSFDRPIEDLEEVFKILIKTNMKLNPKKCTYCIIKTLIINIYKNLFLFNTLYLCIYII